MKPQILAALAATAALAPVSASAEHMDVIGLQMTGNCTLGEFMAVVKDFNEWGKAFGYNAKVAVPIATQDLTTYYWLGTSANAAAFGAAWDAWRDAQPDAKSTPAKLQARFNKCSVNKTRNSYDVY